VVLEPFAWTARSGEFIDRLNNTSYFLVVRLQQTETTAMQLAVATLNRLLIGIPTALLLFLLVLHQQTLFAVELAPGDADRVRCYGTVSDVAGNPVAGATVEYWQRQASLWPYQGGGFNLKESRTTGSDGAFEFETARVTGLLLMRKPGFALTWRQLDQRFQPERDEKQMLVATPAAKLSGYVVDEANQPVAKAAVSIAVAVTELPHAPGSRFNYLTDELAGQFFVTETDASGRFVIENFSTNASAVLKVHSRGKALRLANQRPDNLQFRGYHAGDEIKLLMEPAARIEGRILTDDKSPPPTSARLILRLDKPGFFNDLGQGAPIDGAADGSFSIDEISAGAYHLGAMFGTTGFPDWVAENISFSVEPGQTLRNLRILASRGAVLEVSLLTKTEHQPLANVIVSAAKPGLRTSAGSNENGIALLRLLPGEYEVSAFRYPPSEPPISVTVEAGRTNKLELELK